jgi:predicted RNase H-like HicB family nuclease
MRMTTTERRADRDGLRRSDRRGADELRGVSPDLPGVVAAGETREECEALMREAIVFHIEGLIEDGDPVPPPSNATAVVFVDPAAA